MMALFTTRPGSVLIWLVVSQQIAFAFAHGYLSQPVSRNFYEYLNNRFWNRKCA